MLCFRALESSRAVVVNCSSGVILGTMKVTLGPMEGASDACSFYFRIEYGEASTMVHRCTDKLSKMSIRSPRLTIG